MYDRIVVNPGNPLYLGGPEGGELLLQGRAPGAMSLTDLQNRTWHLLREDGPDTGFPVPAVGDFNVSIVTRDLNIALGQFISETGLAPGICDRMDTFSVFAGMDYPVPPSLVSITRIEYTPAGQQTYKLQGMSFSEFENTVGNVIPTTTGRPRYYREPFAGYLRLMPAPGPGNASGPPSGTLTLSGVPNAGQTVTATFSNAGAAPITTAPYTVLNSDTLASVAVALAARINATAGLKSFLGAATAINNTVVFPTLLTGAAGTAVTYYGTITGAPLVIAPSTAVALQITGDTITFYYSSLGTVLANVGDTPGIPPQFHMALVYRVLMDYWRVKEGFQASKEYERMYDAMVAKAKSFTFDSNRSTQPTISGEYVDDTNAWP